MNITEEITGLINPSVEEQQQFFTKLKDIKYFDLNKDERSDIIDFLCEKANQELAVDYQFHILDNEISYPIDNDEIKSLFEDERIQNLKEIMMTTLNDEEESEESSDVVEE